MDVPLLTAFAEFVAQQISIHARAQEMVEENGRLKVCTSCHWSLDRWSGWLVPDYFNSKSSFMMETIYVQNVRTKLCLKYMYCT